MRIAFAGTPVFAQIQLQALLNAHHNVVVVYTQRDKPSGRGQHVALSPVKTLALSHHLPIEQPTTLKTSDAEATLRHYNVDIMIVAAYGLMLPQNILTIPRYGCVNVHASLLPRWRGASPIQQAILAGDTQTGITLMKMDQGLDTGDILAWGKCNIDSLDTAETLHDKLAILGADLLVQHLNILPTLKGIPQDSALATYAPKIKKEEAQCNWSLPANQLYRQIMAYNPWPIAYSTIQGEILRIWQACVVPMSKSAPPGTILATSKEGITVATGKDALLITHAQFANKKRMPMSEILKSKHDFFALGQRFE